MAIQVYKDNTNTLAKLFFALNECLSFEELIFIGIRNGMFDNIPGTDAEMICYMEDYVLGVESKEVTSNCLKEYEAYLSCKLANNQTLQNLLEQTNDVENNHEPANELSAAVAELFFALKESLTFEELIFIGLRNGMFNNPLGTDVEMIRYMKDYVPDFDNKNVTLESLAEYEATLYQKLAINPTFRKLMAAAKDSLNDELSNTNWVRL